MQDQEIENTRAAIAALERQRATLGDAVLELALAPLRARLAALQRPAGLQHRQVTVLFADIVGSTALAGGLEAEDTLSLLDGTLRRMAALVQAHGGRVLRFTGDGVKAAFGMAEAREDDAERAVRAGLAILAAGRERAEQARHEHGIADFAVRVGVHTGDVALGAGVEADNTAMGAAVNIAARMEQSAPPGALRISHDTWALVRGLFALEPQPPLSVKGVDTPMSTYLVRGALERSAASVERGLQGLSTPLVGREAELLRLHDAIARARQTRQLQALTLVGDAGLGKSRLLRELMAQAPDCRGLALRSQPDGQLRPWGLLRSLLAVQCGVADTDSPELARRKVVEGLAPWFGAEGERQAQLIGQLAGQDFGDSAHVSDLTPRALRDQGLTALRGYLRALAAADGALPVLLVEDLHWADDSSLDLLQHLLAHAAELPLALIMTGRPSLLARRPDWCPPEALVTLSPLAAADGAALLQALLQHMNEVPPQLGELIVGRAEGNPYYMEELVRRLIDDAVIVVGEPHWTAQVERLGSLRLPGTLVGLLQARLDALPAGQRQAARLASVIGHVFWDDALQALDPVAPQALPALQRAAFVRDHDNSAVDGTAERQFDHHLLHQVTYDTLGKTERRGGHAVAARWLAERTKGRGAEFLAMTGEHAERAGEIALAIDCFEQAGREARRRFANAAAAAWLRRALDLLGEADLDRRFGLLSTLTDLADMVGDRTGQEAWLAETAALLERHPDDARLANLHFSRALLADRRGDAAASEPLARRAFELAQRCGAAQWAAMAQGQLAWLNIARHDPLQAAGHVDVGLPWAGRIADPRTRARIEASLLTLSGMVSTLQERLDDARDAFMAVATRGEVLGEPRLLLGALDNLANVYVQLGRWDETVATAERMCTIGHSMGSPRDLANGQLRLAEAAEARGDLAMALHWHQQNLAIYVACDDRRLKCITLRFLGGLHLQLGNVQAAHACCAEAQALVQDLPSPVEDLEVGALAARCELLLGRPEAARSAVHGLLARAAAAGDDCPAKETIGARWACCQVLQAVGDVRAPPMLDQLFADVQARATAVAGPSDRERLIQAQPRFREIVHAYRRLRSGADAG